MSPPANCTMKTFYINTSLRDTVKYPNGSDFTYDLPATLNNVLGIAIRDYKFVPDINGKDMIIRIHDLETIHSTDAITNRASAILFNTQLNHVAKQCLDHYMPLIQTQRRLQSLRIKLLTTTGELYDTDNKEVAFLLEVYCCNEIAN